MMTWLGLWLELGLGLGLGLGFDMLDDDVDHIVLVGVLPPREQVHLRQGRRCGVRCGQPSAPHPN